MVVHWRTFLRPGWDGSHTDIGTSKGLTMDGSVLPGNILVSILTQRCPCPTVRLKRGGDRGGATHIHKRKLSSEAYGEKGYKWGNHLFHTPGSGFM